MSAHEMPCRQCKAPAAFTPVRQKELARFREFMILAAVLFVIALGLYLAGVSIWPWWAAAAGLFVLSQALFKWQLSRWVICDNCGARYTYYGIIRHHSR